MLRDKRLPDKQERILKFIREFMQENGLPPTVRDIQKACRISSTSVVDYNLRIMQRDGHLRRRPDVARGIELPDRPGITPQLRRIPVIASIAAGEPLAVMDPENWAPHEGQENVEISADMLSNKPNLYALKVRGTSMIDALVDDGDIVLVEPVQEAANGDMVVARLKLENETTLKRLYREGPMVRLQPANSQMAPIYAAGENVEVQGKVVGVIRIMG
jgi:repressor LexA